MRTLISLLITIGILLFVAISFWLPEFGLAVAAIALFSWFWAAIYDLIGKENSK